MRWRFLLLWLVLGIGEGVEAEERWSWVYPRPQGRFINDLVATPRGFYAVADWASLGKSVDGMNWEFETVDAFGREGGYLEFLRYGNGVLVVGTLGATFASTDDKEWSRTRFPSPALGMRYAEGAFYRIGKGGILASSKDGRTWDLHSGIDGVDYYDIAIGADGRVLVGEGGVIQHSVDGVKWSRRLSYTTATIVSAVYASGRFHAFTRRDEWLTSRDGVSWDIAPLRGANTRLATSDGAYIFLIGYPGAARHWSEEGGWRVMSSPAPIYPWRIASVDGRFLVGAGTDGMILAGGPQGLATNLTWPSRRRVLRSLAGSPEGVMVACGDDGIVVQRDVGGRWSESIPLSGEVVNFKNCGYFKGKFVVLGNGVGLISTSGKTWRRVSNQLRPVGLCVGQDMLIAASIGMTGETTLAASGNGEQWQSVYSIPASDSVRYVSQGGGVYVAMGLASYTSKDGFSWKRSRTESMGELWGITGLAYGNGSFVAVTGDGYVGVSRDGVFWENRWILPGRRFEGIVFCDGVFVAMISGLNGPPILGTSVDGVRWLLRASVLYPGLCGCIGSGSEGFLLAGGEGIAYSRELAVPKGIAGSLGVGLEGKELVISWASELGRVDVERSEWLGDDLEWKGVPVSGGYLMGTKWELRLPTEIPSGFLRLRRKE